MRIVLALAILLLVGCRDHELEAKWAGAVVVKICKSGTYIYRLHNGELRTGGLGSQRVTSTEVCE